MCESVRVSVRECVCLQALVKPVLATDVVEAVLQELVQARDKCVCVCVCVCGWVGGCG